MTGQSAIGLSIVLLINEKNRLKDFIGKLIFFYDVYVTLLFSLLLGVLLLVGFILIINLCSPLVFAYYIFVPSLFLWCHSYVRDISVYVVDLLMNIKWKNMICFH